MERGVGVNPAGPNLRAEVTDGRLGATVETGRHYPGRVVDKAERLQPGQGYGRVAALVASPIPGPCRQPLRHAVTDIDARVYLVLVVAGLGVENVECRGGVVARNPAITRLSWIRPELDVLVVVPGWVSRLLEEPVSGVDSPSPRVLEDLDRKSVV